MDPLWRYPMLVRIVATASVSNQGVMKVPKKILEEMKLSEGGSLLFVKDEKHGLRVISGNQALVLKTD